MLPFIEVSHLPCSSSFYSTVMQPLGLRYISTTDSVSSPFTLPSIAYGLATSPPTPVFELRQVQPTAERPLRLSHIVFSAESPSVVRQFRQRSKEADGRLLLYDDGGRSSLSRSLDLAEDGRLSVKAAVTDMDGNMMDIVYIPPPPFPEGYSGSTVRRTSSSEGEISRIMTWNYDVAAPDVSPRGPAAPFTASAPVSSRAAASAEDDVRPILRRVTTTSTTFLSPTTTTEASLSPRQNSSGLTAGAVVGTLLGVAVASAAIGAGVAYGAMKHEWLCGSDGEPPSLQRRSTCLLGAARGPYSEYPPPRDYYQPLADRRPPPTLLTRYPHSQAHRDSGDDMYGDTRSRHSSRARPSSASATTVVRNRSEASSSRKPLLLTDAEHRGGSYVSASASPKHSARTSERMMIEKTVLAAARTTSSSSSSTSRASGSGRSNKLYTEAAVAAAAPPSLRRRSTYDDGGGGSNSYVSSRSHRTASTARASPAAAAAAAAMQATVQTELGSLGSRPPAASLVSRRADSYASAREMAAPASWVSARRVELPRSGVGSSKAGYGDREEDDDVCSIAPSDSISCVGSSRR